MPDQTQPQPPEGCVYGPWWDADRKVWLCILSLPVGGFCTKGYKAPYGWVERFCHSEAELLRVAAERDELRAEVEKKDRFIERWKVEVDDLQAEIERLKKELEWEKRI